LNQNPAPDFCFDAFASREPVSTPDQVRGRLSLENASDLTMRFEGSHFLVGMIAAETCFPFLGIMPL
jgi:hypothetical protein